MPFICDHVTEKCFEPAGDYRTACSHAVGHSWHAECLGGRCDRFADWGDKQNPRPLNPTYVKHVEI